MPNHIDFQNSAVFSILILQPTAVGLSPVQTFSWL